MAEPKRTFKLGRSPRTFDPRVPHLSALMSGRDFEPLPPSVDYTRHMPDELGMMMNDTLGDCTCAAFYHALQVWSFNASNGKKMDTEPDSDVEKLYELACGYNPKHGGEGPGGNEQSVLAYLLTQGAPYGHHGKTTHKIAAFVEVDGRNHDDVKRTIYDCGIAYIGFRVPQTIMPVGQPPLKVWTLDGSHANPKIIGGHAVILAGYDADGVRVISWGEYYTMKWDFFTRYVDEVYAIADEMWVAATGRTPGGLSMDELKHQMQALQQQMAAAA